MRYAPHVLLALLVLILPPLLFFLLALTAFVAYTAVVMVAFNTFASELRLTFTEAAALTVADAIKLFSF